MNLICIIADTLRADYLGCYGNPWVQTPNLDRLAREGIVLDELYVEGLPTIPERLVFFTGTYTLPFRGWQPLWKSDVTLTEVLKDQGYTSAFITDVPHYFAPNMNFHRSFDEWALVRGQEYDRYAASSGPGQSPDLFMKEGWQEIPRAHRHLRAEDPRRYLARYLRNVAGRRCEEDYFSAQVMRQSINWLVDNHAKDPFFLWIDCFDPHEPWDPPARYYERYAPSGYDGPWLIAPWMISVDANDFTADEIAHMKALYAGEITFLDAWLGRLLDTIWELGLHQSTLILVTSDHGTQLGEHGTISKTGSLRHTNFREKVRVPGILYHPDAEKGHHIEQLMWTPDLMPTLLSLLGVELPTTVHGTPQPWIARNPVPTGKALGREYVISGHHAGTNWRVTDGKWAYVSCEKPELYDLSVDPAEQHNVADQYPGQVERLQAKIEAFDEHAKTLTQPRPGENR